MGFPATEKFLLQLSAACVAFFTW